MKTTATGHSSHAAAGAVSTTRDRQPALGRVYRAGADEAVPAPLALEVSARP